MTTDHTGQATAATSTSTRTRRPRSKAPESPQTAPDPGLGDHTTPGPIVSEAYDRDPNRGGCAGCAERQRATVAAVGQLAAELDETTRRQWGMIGAALGVGIVAAGLAVLAILTARRAATGGTDDE